MRTGLDELRIPYLAGEVTPTFDVRASRDYAVWSVGLLSATISGSLCSDDFFDSGHKACWWDSALNSAGVLTRLANPATLGYADGWLAGTGAGDLTAPALAGAPACKPFCKPGLRANGTGYCVFYIGPDDKLYRVELAPDLSVLGVSAGRALYASPACAAALPVSATACFVVGYQNHVLWAKQFVYDPFTDTWTAALPQTLRADLDLTWQDLTWCGAAAGPAGGGACILVVPGGANGMCVSVVYDPATNTYSDPTFVLATAGSDWLRRVWVAGLTGPYNGRIWGLAETNMNGNGAAQHIRLISTADGLSWRDEGFVSEVEVRGKLHIDGATMWAASLCTVLSAPAIARIAGTAAPSETAILRARDFTVTNNGPNAAMALTMTLLQDDNLLEGGALLEVLVGHAAVTGIITGAPVFTGHMDAVTDVFSAGRAEYAVEARSRFGLLVGETAYMPLTTLDWRGRNTFHTAFSEAGLPAISLSLSADSGYWWAEYDGQAGAFGLRCTAAGVGYVPLPVDNIQAMARLRFKTGAAAGLAFFVADETISEADRWELGLYGTSLELRRLVGGVTTALATRVVTGYATGQVAEIVLDIMPDHITGYLVEGAAPAAWQKVTYAGWAADAAPAAAQVLPYTLGIFADASVDSPAVFYELAMCDSGRPYAVQEALAMIADIAGLDAETHEMVYGGAELPVNVRSISCDLSLTAPGDGLAWLSGAAWMKFYEAYIEIRSSDGVIACQPYNRAIVPAGAVLRVIGHNSFVSIYQGRRFLCGFRMDMPKYAFGLDVLAAGQTITLPECYDPVQTGDTAWFAWDALQPADGLLSSLLTQRRIYLIETADGTLDIRGAWPTGDVLIDAGHPVGGYAYYHRGTLQLERTADRRNIAGIFAVTDIQGRRVFLIEPGMIARTRRVAAQDSQWAFTPAEALREASLLRGDAVRQGNMRHLTRLWDPALEPGDTFVFGAEGWTGVAARYSITFGRTEDGKLKHECKILAESAEAAATSGVWGTNAWNNCYWG